MKSSKQRRTSPVPIFRTLLLHVTQNIFSDLQSRRFGAGSKAIRYPRAVTWKGHLMSVPFWSTRNLFFGKYTSECFSFLCHLCHCLQVLACSIIWSARKPRLGIFEKTEMLRCSSVFWRLVRTYRMRLLKFDFFSQEKTSLTINSQCVSQTPSSAFLTWLQFQLLEAYWQLCGHGCYHLKTYPGLQNFERVDLRPKTLLDIYCFLGDLTSYRKLVVVGTTELNDVSCQQRQIIGNRSHNQRGWGTRLDPEQQRRSPGTEKHWVDAKEDSW